MNYKVVPYGKKSVRRNYSKIRTDVTIPDLVKIQTESFDKFITTGLKELFEDISPIALPNNPNLKIYFVDYEFEEPKFDIVESKLRDTNYSRPLKAKVRLERTQTGEQIEETLFMGDIPYMTPAGTFIINGAERVIISQIVRSSGVYFSKDIDKKTGDTKVAGQIIPTRGAWINYEMGSRKVLYGELDRSKKIPLTTILRAFGLETNEQIINLFGNSEYLEATFEKDDATDKDDAVKKVYSKLRSGEDNVPAEGARRFIQERFFDDKRYDLQKVGRYKYNIKLDIFQRAKGLRLAEDIIAHEPIFDDETGELLFDENDVIATAGTVILDETLETLKKSRQAFRKVVDLGNTLCEDPVCEILKVIDPQDGEVFNLIGNDSREQALHITMSDIVASLSYYFGLYKGIGTLDDIDHLGNRRLRLVGELLKNQFRIGFTKLEKHTLDRMSTTDPNEATPTSLINIKPLTSTLKEFFGSSQLSQFMDQINPLAEITQKRRISALGTGGIARDRAGVEVRDVHNSHYGRMCPIETPEGPSIGLITSLATYGKVNEYGFIQSPYLALEKDENGNKRVPISKAENDKLTSTGFGLSNEDSRIVYLSADDEAGKVIASASTLIDENGYIIDEKVIARKDGETQIVDRNEVTHMDVSPKQIVSVAAACVPFLEHDDATRALMGANMQRQAVPIINPESPIVATGMEYRAAKDSGSAVVCEGDGVVRYVDAKCIKIIEDTGEIRNYKLYQFLRSNSATAIMQRPIVSVGERVEKGDVIADGQSMKDGELALGRNVRVAFMTWDGYNYEDAVIMSEKMVYDDVYTSLHIDEYQIELRDTKLGKEEFTNIIPGASSEAISHLDENGIIIPGTEVKEGDYLVGKVTPKGQSEPSAEDKLLFAIFGNKSQDVRDSSLKVPHGGGGIVQSIQHYKKSNGDDLPPTVNEVVRVYIVQKRKIKIGDKMAGRHGNKGVISNILPLEDMPFTADGQPIDIMLNPQGVPSRMNIGQVLELHLGMAAKKLGVKVATPVFDGATIEDIEEIMQEAGLPLDGKQTLYDGRSGEPFENKVNVGIMYFVKLSHMVDDKLHARDIGPYTLVTQQPMGGKAQNGGQRFGEMEVWALEAYGASHCLQEMLTVKSDDMTGRNKVYSAITEGKPIPEPSIPESFRVLTRELQALGIKVELINENGEDETKKSIVEYAKSNNDKLGI